jgi:hypothetical protein
MKTIRGETGLIAAATGKAPLLENREKWGTLGLPISAGEVGHPPIFHHLKCTCVYYRLDAIQPQPKAVNTDSRAGLPNRQL